MTEALRRLPDQDRPSKHLLPGMLDGLDKVGASVRENVEGHFGYSRPLRVLG